ncbi:MAG: hypothetical protein JKY37_33770 [Nannocystaceae bacterium]|nr:hypothetical protein [Nannocystaceae bacterium]
MTNLNPDAQALLELAQDYDTPKSERLLAIGAGLQARVTAGDPGPGVDMPTTGSGVSTTGMAAATKLAIVAVGTMLACVAIYTLTPADAPSAPVTYASETDTITKTTVEADPPQAAIPHHDPVVVADESPSAAEPNVELAVAAPTPKRPKQRPQGASKKRRDSVAPRLDPAAEIAIMREARAALGRGDASLALKRLEAHRDQFPKGILVQERLVSHAQAQCMRGRKATARKEVAAFLRRYPTSVLANRARSICRDNAVQKSSE